MKSTGLRRVKRRQVVQAKAELIPVKKLTAFLLRSRSLITEWQLYIVSKIVAWVVGRRVHAARLTTFGYSMQN